jgi:hypothetical protein
VLPPGVVPRVAPKLRWQAGIFNPDPRAELYRSAAATIGLHPAFARLLRSVTVRAWTIGHLVEQASARCRAALLQPSPLGDFQAAGKFSRALIRSSERRRRSLSTK